MFACSRTIMWPCNSSRSRAKCADSKPRPTSPTGRTWAPARLAPTVSSDLPTPMRRVIRIGSTGLSRRESDWTMVPDSGRGSARPKAMFWLRRVHFSGNLRATVASHSAQDDGIIRTYYECDVLTQELGVGQHAGGESFMVCGWLGGHGKRQRRQQLLHAVQFDHRRQRYSDLDVGREQSFQHEHQ